MRSSALVFALVIGLIACGGKGKAADTTGGDPPAATLYTRLGEKPAIEAVIDKFLSNVVADARINARFAHLDAGGVARLRGHLVDQVCNATGGPCEYKGRNMVESHAGMNITEDEFNALVEDLVKALDELGVPEAEKGELLGALGGMKGDIVGK